MEVDSKKYVNYAIIGNQKVTATFSKKGELLRLYYGAPDYKQFINQFHVGVKVNDSAIIYLHDDINNFYNQKYLENTNILQTEILNSYFNLKITQTDFVPLTENVIIKKYVLKNESDKVQNINFLAYSDILTDINNDTAGFVKDEALLQYNHDYSICTFSKEKLLSYQVNNVKENLWSGKIAGKDYIGMSPNSAISYDIGVLNPGEEKEIALFILVNDNNERNLLGELDFEISRIKNFDVDFLLNECREYWENFVKEHDKLRVLKSDLSDDIKNIYTRTCLLFPLLQNREIGGISAGMEVDEYKTKCGRYSYCWPRDAIFITKAYDILGMKEEAAKFYSKFCRRTQNKKGNWEQRFYTDGRLAPSWGYQVDETASVIIGVYEHYKFTNDDEFLKSNFNMCDKAVEFLRKYMQDLYDDNIKQKSYDLWEEFEGITLYSLSSVYSAMNVMSKIDKKMLKIAGDKLIPAKQKKIDEREKSIKSEILKIKEYIVNTFWNNERQSFVRNTCDNRLDISLLSLTTPFDVLDLNDEKVKLTASAIKNSLRTNTSGYLRYEADTYMGGNNPWIIATLWMALYLLEDGKKDEALDCFNFSVSSATSHGFLGEQVDNVNLENVWVVGLAWSHAIFIIVLEKILKG